MDYIEYKVIVFDDGIIYWFYDNELHREDGPAVTLPNASYEWWYKGELHREGGPAEVDLTLGLTKYYIHGKLHRMDGAAVEYRDGSLEWWIEGIQLSEEAFNLKVKE